MVVRAGDLYFDYIANENKYHSRNHFALHTQKKTAVLVSTAVFSELTGPMWPAQIVAMTIQASSDVPSVFQYMPST